MKKCLMSYPKRVHIISPNNYILSKPYLTVLKNVSTTNIIHDSNISNININFLNTATLSNSKTTYSIMPNYNYIAHLELYYSYPDKVRKLYVPVNIFNNVLYINHEGFSLSITITSNTSLSINSFYMTYSNVLIKNIIGYQTPVDYTTLKLKTDTCLVKQYPKIVSLVEKLYNNYDAADGDFWRAGDRYYRVGLCYDNTQLMTSIDGHSWTTVNRSWSSSDARQWYRYPGYYNGYYFVRNGNSPYSIWYSTDGINWNTIDKQISASGTTASFSDAYPIFPVNGYFITQLSGATSFNYTKDFQSLSYISFGTTSRCYGMYYINNTYLAYFQNNSKVYTSKDFVTWSNTTTTEKVYLNNYNQLIPFNCKLYGCSSYSSYPGIFCSEDGIAWTKISDIPTRALYIIQNKLIAVPNTPSTYPKLLYSIDGVTFNESQASNPSSSTLSIEPTNNGSFVCIGEEQLFYTKDGILWEDIQTILPQLIQDKISSRNIYSCRIAAINDTLWFGSINYINGMIEAEGGYYGMIKYYHNLNDSTIIPGYTEVAK